MDQFPPKSPEITTNHHNSIEIVVQSLYQTFCQISPYLSQLGIDRLKPLLTQITLQLVFSQRNLSPVSLRDQFTLLAHQFEKIHSDGNVAEMLAQESLDLLDNACIALSQISSDQFDTLNNTLIELFEGILKIDLTPSHVQNVQSLLDTVSSKGIPLSPKLSELVSQVKTRIASI